MGTNIEIEVVKLGDFDSDIQKYYIWALSNNPLPVNTKLEIKGSSKISKQLRGFYFLLIDELFSNEEYRFLLVDEKYYSFFQKISNIYLEFKDDGFLDYENFRNDILKAFRYSLNTSVGKPSSIQHMDREELTETVNLIIAKAISIGVNLDDFLDENKPISLKKEERKKRKIKLQCNRR